jgi:hypothetical protein|tara:strand:- start:688 stop:1707 length:1020 start_codon:yes stop_codon:yes gene_type:complete
MAEQQMHSTEVDLDAQTKNVEQLDPDPFKTIYEMENAAQRQEIETIGNAQGGVGPASSSDTSRMEPARTSGETATSPNAPSESAGKRPGIDTVLNDVESQLSPGHADVIRGVLTGFHRTQAEWKTQQAELAEHIAEVKTLRNDLQQPRSEPDPNDPLTNVSPHQWELFNRMLEQQGIPNRAELDAREVEENQKDYVSEDIDQGIEQWGDQFGHRGPDGNFVYNAEIHDAMQEEFNRLYDPSRGPTARDLYRLVNFDQMIQSAESRGRETGQSEQSNGAARRVNEAIRGVVERTSASSVNPVPLIYDREKDRRNSGQIDLDTVVARASAAAMRRLPSIPI